MSEVAAPKSANIISVIASMHEANGVVAHSFKLAESSSFEKSVDIVVYNPQNFSVELSGLLPLESGSEVLQRIKSLKSRIDEVMYWTQVPQDLMDSLESFKTESIGYVFDGVLNESFSIFTKELRSSLELLPRQQMLHKLACDLSLDDEFRRLLTEAQNVGFETYSMQVFDDYVQTHDPIKGAVIKNGLKNTLSGILNFQPDVPEEIKSFARYMTENLFNPISAASHSVAR
jgi:hypothetical protein